MSAQGVVHFSAAITAIVLGAVVLSLPKGTVRHRRLGVAFVIAMLTLNALGLTIWERGLTIFHLLAVVSLATVAAGVVAVRRRRAGLRGAISHAYFMPWAYVGLLAAGVGQATAALSDSEPAVWVSIAATLGIGGALVQWQVPMSVRRTFPAADFG